MRRTQPDLRTAALFGGPEPCNGDLQPPPRQSPVPAPRLLGNPAVARRLPPEVLSPTEVMALLAACSSRWSGTRNRALLGVLYRAGLRITEALSLHEKDLAPRTGAVRVLRGKGGRSRTVGMDPAGFALVAAWQPRRANLGLGPGHPLFCLRDGRPVTSSYIRVLLPRLARAAGIEKRVHAHGLRHTHAAELRQGGVEVGLISKQLGHASIATTALYLDHIQPLRVVEAVRARTWTGAVT